MVERIDRVKYEKPALSSTKEPWETLFLTGPAEFLCQTIAKLLSADAAWNAVFGDFIDPYKRMDYGIRNLPALRLYIDTYAKRHETWYVEGMVTLDMIFPPSIRRKELEQLPSTFAAAMLQQFRRPSFFAAVNEDCPAVNELGKTFDVDKSLAFDADGTGDDKTLCPLTQINANFRMNLAEWDLYCESDNREVDSPFLRTLGDLTDLRITIQGLDDDESESI